MSRSEKYVDYDNQPLNLVRFITADVQVGRKKVKNARIVITRNGQRSLIGRDWLDQLNFRLGEANKNSEYNNDVNNINNQNINSEKIKQTFPNLFIRKGKLKGHQIKSEFEKAQR